ncbi:glycosyltransferase family 2 protein [Synechococcus sp. CS-1329]|jgi:hypothetical protein|uniref:hypothetical protein n=1 Tax=Synechococcus sp. CS-1329 TaxID=2847975 RepID=UPI00223AEC77|nr:hypothetical protein [Synechococcus sp. CS-1329]MCT0218412.1 glycosyltransferase family 2 protein [Synechococcus sp. CS-1329]
MAFSTPVLLLAFRRPDTTRPVLEALRQLRPSQLFVACDGPRATVADDQAACAATRALIDAAIDWPCRVERLYRHHNRGCRRGVSEAIDWFFDQVPEGIVLEDDVVPTADFFRYCALLLERYRHDGRIGAISGNNFQRARPRDGSSYYFSLYNHVWGWASWRRAWRSYDAELASWPSFRDQGWLEQIGGRRFSRYWSGCIERVWQGECDTWDYIWTYSCWRQGLLTCLPAVNLVENVGFGHAHATHTRHGPSPHRGTAALETELVHPAQLLRDRAADDFTFRSQFQPPLPQRLLRRALRPGRWGGVS